MKLFFLLSGLTVVFAAGCVSTGSFNLEGVEPCNIAMIKLTVVQAGNRKFAEKHDVRIGEYFYLSDTDYKARVTHYVPHFMRSLSMGTVTSQSNEPVNPAIRIELLRNKTIIYHLWFLAGTPFYHRSRTPGFGFIVESVEYGPSGAPDFTKMEIEPSTEEKERLERGFHGMKKKKAAAGATKAEEKKEEKKNSKSLQK